MARWITALGCMATSACLAGCPSPHSQSPSHRRASVAPVPGSAHPSSAVIAETRADVDADTWIASLGRAPATALPDRAEGVLHTGLTPWGQPQQPGGEGWMIDLFEIDVRELRRRGGYSFTVDGVNGWGVWSFTTVDPPHGGFDVATPTGEISIDGRGVFYYSPAPGGPSRHVHVVALDVNGGRGAPALSASFAGIGTQRIEILDGTPAFAPIADEVMASAHLAWRDALRLHRREIADVVDEARQRLDDLRPGIRLGDPLLREGFSLAYASGRLTITFERTITKAGQAGREQSLGPAAAQDLFASQPPLRGLHAEVGAHLAFEVVATADGRLAARWFPPSPIARYRCGESAPPPCDYGAEHWQNAP